MDEQNDSNELDVKDGDLLDAANNILALLDYSQKLENEEDLFLDDFYVSIIGNLLSDIQPEITPGETKEDKAEIMNKLIKTLSQAIEVDLPHINGAAIVLEHDKVSAKNLLDLIAELIKAIIANNLEEGEEEDDEVQKKNNFSEKKNKSDKKNQNDNFIKKVRNNLDLSERNGLNKNIEIYNDESDENDIDNIQNGNKSKKNEIIEEINNGDIDSKESDKKYKNKSGEKISLKDKEKENQNNLNALTNNSTKSNKNNSNIKEEENEKDKKLSSLKKSKNDDEESNKKLKKESSKKKE